MEQRELIARLAAGEPFGDRAPQRIDTHISVVFLTDTRAYKLKRALRTAYLDYSTLEDRKRGAEREIALNRRTAPELYLRAVPVSLDSDNRLTIGGSGPPIEWLVEMNRFDPRATFDVLVSSTGLADPVLTTLADEIARFHDNAAIIHDTDFSTTLDTVIASNREELFAAGDSVFNAAGIEALTARHRAFLQALSGVIERRAQNRRIRECHGDLHLGNICLIDGHPRIFDAIEFNDDFNRIDTLYDTAFLLMDLAARGLGAAANLVFNRYMFRMTDFDGLRVLPLYLSVRAAIRAHVMAKAASEHTDPADRDRCNELARTYFGASTAALQESEARIVAIGGYSGTGKSTLARRVAPYLDTSPGAVVLSSDLIRKRRYGVEPENRLGPRMYRAEVSRKIYAEMFKSAGDVVSQGRSVIVDATFIDENSRVEIEKVALDCSVPFDGIWLTGAPDNLARRIAARPQGASDATTEVLDKQLETGPGDLQWRSIDTTASSDGGIDAVARELRLAAFVP